MTTISGFVQPVDASAVTSDNHLAAVIDEISPWSWPPVVGWNNDIPANNGAETNNLPISEQGTLESGGVVEGSFFFDWYNTIHIVPWLIELGNLLSEQQSDVEVWNAYLTGQLLSAVTPTDTDGLNLTQPEAAPTTFQALESRIYQLSVSTVGPSSIDASYLFDFPADDPVLLVTGTRVIVWPFRPNWKQPVTERLEWLTDVLEADDGTEQCIQLRSAPRRFFEYLLTASQADKRRLETLLWDWHARVFALPVWTDPGRLSAPVSAGDTVLSIPTDNLDYHDGGLAVLISDTATYEALEIQTVASGSITLVRPLLNNWPAGTRIFPARTARLADSQELDLYTATLENALVKFTLQDNTAVAAAEFNASQYRGLPVLETRPNWREDISKAYRRKLQVFDNTTGVQSVDDLSGRPVTVQDYLWTRKGKDDIQALRKWLHARAGKLTPIWVSTYQADLVLTDDVQATDTHIKVQNTGYSKFIKQAIGRRDVCIRLTDGSRFYRRITASIEVDDQVEQLSIDSQLGQLVKTGDIRMISWLQLCRVESDAVELQWHTPEAAECRHYFRGKNDDV